MIPIAKIKMGKEELEAVRGVMESGQLSSGPKVAEFEEEFAKRIGADYGIAVCNATIALQLSLQALQVRGHVAVPALSFFATASCVVNNGLRPVFVDVDERTYNIDTGDLEAKLKRHKSVDTVIPVALYGQSYDADEVARIAKKNNLKVIQDLAQAHDALFDKRKLGDFGDLSCYSFYATKNITTLGEGGMITCNSKKLYDHLKLLVNQGQVQKYVHGLFGFNYRMTEAQAAVGLVQLGKLDEYNEARKKNANKLTKTLDSLDHFVPPFVSEKCDHVYHMYTAKTDLDRDEVVNALRKKGVGAVPIYPMPIYEQDAFKHAFGAPCLVAKRLTGKAFHLPVHPHVTRDELEFICEKLKEVNNNG